MNVATSCINLYYIYVSHARVDGMVFLSILNWINIFVSISPKQLKKFSNDLKNSPLLKLGFFFFIFMKNCPFPQIVSLKIMFTPKFEQKLHFPPISTVSKFPLIQKNKHGYLTISASLYSGNCFNMKQANTSSQ